MTKIKRITFLALTVPFLLSPMSTLGAEKKAQAVKPYPLDKCLVSGKKLDLASPKLVTQVHAGQEVKFCCQMCVADFPKDSAKHMAKIKAAAKKVKPYPLKTCIVSGEELGGMGDPYVLISQRQEVKFCCKGCVKDFAKDSKGYLKKVADARK